MKNPVFVFQLSELKLGLAERNQLLLDMQRHLLNHEVTNRLLEANVQRKELELQYYKERDHTGVIKRSNTFTGSDLNQRPVSSPIRTSFYRRPTRHRNIFASDRHDMS